MGLQSGSNFLDPPRGLGPSAIELWRARCQGGEAIGKVEPLEDGKTWVVVKIMVPIRVMLGSYWGYMGDNGKENRNYYHGLYGWLSKLWSLFGYPKY